MKSRGEIEKKLQQLKRLIESEQDAGRLHTVEAFKQQNNILTWVLEPKPSIALKCPKCNYIWEYGGDSDLYVTCPRCIRKSLIDDSIYLEGSDST